MARKPFRFTTHEAAARAEGRSWRGLSVEERVSAVETLRQVTMGIYGEAPPRMGRAYRIVELAPRNRTRKRPAARRRAR